MSRTAPVDGDSDAALELLTALELLLAHGFKEQKSSSLNPRAWFSAPTFWNFVALLEHYHEPARKARALKATHLAPPHAPLFRP